MTLESDSLSPSSLFDTNEYERQIQVWLLYLFKHCLVCVVGTKQRSGNGGNVQALAHTPGSTCPELLEERRPPKANTVDIQCG